MKPKPQPGDVFELFQARFDQLLNPNHKLILTAYEFAYLNIERLQPSRIASG